MDGSRAMSYVAIMGILGGLCFPTYTQELFSYATGEYGGYMGGTTQFQQTAVRSRIDCARTCSNNLDCEGYMFDPATNRCHTMNQTLTNTTGLAPTAGASYYIKSTDEGTCNPNTSCPPVDGQYHDVGFGNTCIKLRIVSAVLDHQSAALDCEATGGRLFLLNDLDRWNIFVNLSGCTGISCCYLVAGTNTNAANYSATDAFRSPTGDVIPVEAPLWQYATSASLPNYYRPETEHCLMLDLDHYHTYPCTSTRAYLCEK